MIQFVVRGRRCELAALWGCLLIAVGGSRAAAAEHPVIPGFERFYSQADADPLRGGELLLGELNCTSCHQAEGALAAIAATKQAPILDGVRERLQTEFLRKFIAAPQQVKPGTTMPSLFEGLPEAERAQQVDALVQFLSAGEAAPPAGEAVRPGARERGEALFHQVGCVACHGGRKADDKPLATSAPLGPLGQKYRLSGLTAFLLDPLHVRPSARMPNLNLTKQEAEDVAAYLLPELPEIGGLEYRYYEGNWNALPDFSKLTPVAQGRTDQIGLEVAKRKDQFGLVFEGAIELPADGAYQFILGSDDGSRLSIDDQVVLDNDGLHSANPKATRPPVTLKKGQHRLLLEYFEKDANEALMAEIEGPGLPRQPLANVRVKTPPPAAVAEATVADPAQIALGAKLFATKGCANCHTKHEAGKLIAAEAAAPPLRSLRGVAGCVNGPARPGVPAYHLSDAQRKALAAVLAAQATIQPLAAKESIELTMQRYNCYACHQRGELGGVEAARNPHFQGTQAEMGDEGRIPPHLTGVGGKLKRKWLDAILAQGADARPYMLTRMPKFGAGNLAPLAALLEQADQLAPLPEKPTDWKQARAAGHQLVGSRGFSCIACHTFGKYKATGVQSIDMTIMHERLREEWFRRYVRDPQSFRPGTRMPQAWTKDVSMLPKLLDGQSDTQIDAIWKYLAAGSRAKLPDGLVTGSMMLIPRDEAVIHRNFIARAGARAIAVGYPEGVHLAFDAEKGRLALAWRGEFIDAQLPWSGRGVGFNNPAGVNVLAFPDATAFAKLAKPDEAWPKTPPKQQGYQFRGYRLSADQRPTFLYSVGDVQITDFPNPHETPAGAELLRKLTVQGGKSGETLWFRAAVAPQITPLDGGWHQVGPDYKVRLQAAGVTPVIRQQGGQQELLVPVALGGKPVEITQELQW